MGMKLVCLLFTLATFVIAKPKRVDIDVDALLKGSDSLLDGLKNVQQRTKETLKLAKGLRKNVGKDQQGDFDNFFKFIAEHDKQYSNETALKGRFSNYRKSLQEITKLNAQNNGASFAPNQFSDLTAEEFTQLYTGAKAHDKPIGGIPYKNLRNSRSKRAVLPDNFDWRDRGAITSVKNQQKCGCCYAFSSLAATEAVFYIANNYTYDMSEQQIASCSPDTENAGCAGGYIDDTLRTIAKNGVGLEDEYPYTSGSTGVLDACVPNKPRYAFISNYTVVTSYDEDELKEAIYTKGPAVVIIDSRQLKSYDKGILDPVEPTDGWRVDHAVSIIGYGVNAKGVTFWIAKNSWGDTWGGLAGYFKVRRGVNALNLGNTVLIPLA